MPMKAKVGSGSRAREKCENRKRRQADKQMKFINMLLITPDNGRDRARGRHGQGCYAGLCYALLCVHFAYKLPN